MAQSSSKDQNREDVDVGVPSNTRNFTLDFQLLQTLRRESKYCDLVIQSRVTDNNEVIPCHKILLSTVSDYFREALVEETRNLYFDTIGHETLQLLINYIYTGGRITLSPENVFQTFAGAKELKLTMLEEDCLAFIPSLVTVPEVTRVLEFARLHQHEDLLHACVNFILKHLEEVKASGFLELKYESVKLIVEQYGQMGVAAESAPEDTMLCAVVEWLRSDKSPEEERLKHAFSLLKCLPLKEVEVRVLRQKLRDDPTMSSMPEVCSLYMDVLEEKSRTKETEESAVTTLQMKKKKPVVENPETGHSKRFRSSNSSRSPIASSLGRVESVTSVRAGSIPLRSNSSEDADGKVRKGLIFFITRDGKSLTQNSLWSLDLVTKEEEIVGTYPYLRNGHALIYHNHGIYSIGGEGRGHWKDKGLRNYDLEKDLWRNLSEMAVPRSEFCSVIAGGYLYVIGGESMHVAALNTVERYFRGSDPSDSEGLFRKREDVASMIQSRTNFGVGVVNGQIYVLGGSKEWKASAATMLDSVECYDQVNNTWSNKRPMLVKRADMAVATVGPHIYALGGLASNRSNFVRRTNSVNVYDSRDDTWKEGVPMKEKRSYFSAVTLNNCIYAVGGDRSKQPTLERFDVENQKWEDLGPLPAEGIYNSVGFSAE